MLIDNAEATRLLDRELTGFRDESYVQLVGRIEAGSLRYEGSGAHGARYQVGIAFVWDDRAGGNVRVMGSIDDGGLRAFVPLTRSFIKPADGSFVGE